MLVCQNILCNLSHGFVLTILLKLWMLPIYWQEERVLTESKAGNGSWQFYLERFNREGGKGEQKTYCNNQLFITTILT